VSVVDGVDGQTVGSDVDDVNCAAGIADDKVSLDRHRRTHRVALSTHQSTVYYSAPPPIAERSIVMSVQKRPQDFGRGGVNAPLPLEAKKIRKFDYGMVHSEVYLNKCVVSIAPFSTPACPDCSQNIT